MSISPTINSPKSTNSPKEKRSFTFFRSRTLSGSSNESSGPSSPRLSPRSLFDKVRKRSQPDATKPLKDSLKAPTVVVAPILPIETINNDGKKTLGPPIATNNTTVSSRKRLSHSISEENDDQIHNETNNNYSELNYKTYHGASQSFRYKLSSKNCQTKQLVENLSNMNVNNKVSLFFIIFFLEVSGYC
jgi:hypothetical protein